MKTYKQFIDEALKASVIKSAARQLFRNKSVQKQVLKKPGNTPKKVSFTRLYHGTTKPASQQISKSGWRTDTNVSRQMTGSGVYTTPQKSAAQMYANKRSVQRGEEPAVRTFRIPTSKYKQVKSQRQQSGTWKFKTSGQQFNAVQMTPKGANRYDITDKPKSAVDFNPNQKQELRQRVSTSLKKPRNVEVLRKEIETAERRKRKGSSQSQSTPPKVPDQYKVEKLY